MKKKLSFFHLIALPSPGGIFGDNQAGIPARSITYLPMKIIVPFSLFAAAALLMAGCQSAPPQNDFAEKTHRTYNPETGTWEQSPPYGKESNKSDQ
jgi:hypothetical protein